jgi:hypothetical protein
MNQEYKSEQIKPNFERIAFFLAPQWQKAKPEIYSSMKDEAEEMYKDIWGRIEKEEIESTYYSNLKELLKEYDIESMLPDFLIIGYHFRRQYKAICKIRTDLNSEEIDEIKKRDFSVIEALNFLHESNYEAEIILKSLKFGEKISLISPGIIDLLYKGLLEYHIENDIFFEKGNNPEEITDWGLYFKERYKEEKAKISKKGRKKGVYIIKKIALKLWEYLQEYTNIKAMEGTHNSREQARFIYRFLDIHGLIEESEYKIRKEDIVSYYIKKAKEYQ